MTNLRSEMFGTAFGTRFQLVVCDKSQHTLCVGNWTPNRPQVGDTIRGANMVMAPARSGDFNE